MEFTVWQFEENIEVMGISLKEFRSNYFISLTAFRIITILKMLLDGPCDDKDINKKLQSEVIGSKVLSKDTISIYINTLRAIGCEIPRVSKKTNNKYVLKSHPFCFSLSSQDIDSLVKIHRIISCKSDVKCIYNYELFLSKLLENVHTKNKKKLLEVKKSILRNDLDNISCELIDLIEECCKNNKKILINYNSPESENNVYEYLPDKLSHEYGSFYIEGYDTLSKQSKYLRLDRVKSATSIEAPKETYEPEIITATYKLLGMTALLFVPSQNDKIISKNNNEIIIETKVKNTFRFVHNVLSWGKECVLISPDFLRQEVINNLKKMKNSYI